MNWWKTLAGWVRAILIKDQSTNRGAYSVDRNVVGMIPLPVEAIVPGVPISLQAKNPTTKENWKNHVGTIVDNVKGDELYMTEEPVSVTFFYFPDAPMQGDIDNPVKLILDALKGRVFTDDRQVARVLAEKFEPDRAHTFLGTELPVTNTLSRAIVEKKPVSYIRVDFADGFE